ncbi:MAG: alpha-glucuronidase [Spirochaetales bacterium]|nr:alpha-glucuronidase [Spirochaetales bacterium]
MINEDGYELWLRYPAISEKIWRKKYEKKITGIMIPGRSKTLIEARDALMRGLSGLLGITIRAFDTLQTDGIIVAGTYDSLKPIFCGPGTLEQIKKIGEGEYAITEVTYTGKRIITITAANEIDILYGCFHFLRLCATLSPLDNLTVSESPAIHLRILNHWDNLDGTIERGYAGFSLWDWHKLPDYISPRCVDYARANASIGINGTVLNSVNANSLSLSREYLSKAGALADCFRPFGIKVYLSICFSAPIELDALPTSDPCSPEVAGWWKQKAEEIYRIIPDFGGFLVKADSEGQPGPHDYGRTHADGANMLADVLADYGGIVIWRAFVYDYKIKEDRVKQAWTEFTPLDGKFRKNVVIQVKNGPIDFQPREPFHPLFGAMPHSNLAVEFQLTQEYLGLAAHLVYLAPLIKECLDSDTYAHGPGSTVARVIDGSLYGSPITGIAAVANTGSDRNWCGHPFAQANWYAYGRLAWNHRLKAEDIAEEWIRMTFSNNREVVDTMKTMMMCSRENAVNYMTPLGLHHIMAYNHHYGPGPWVDFGRQDWTSVYYHRADEDGIGFDRTGTGSDAASQYHEPVKKRFADMDRCPETLLLWFHHVAWKRRMKSGRTLWEELCFRYADGIRGVRAMIDEWESLKGRIDRARFQHVRVLLALQEKEAIWWRDACLLYFKEFSRMPFPEGYEKPEKTLDEVKEIRHFYVPGISNPFIPKKPDEKTHDGEEIL